MVHKLYVKDPALALANAQADNADLRAINARLEAEHAIWQTHELHPVGTRERIAALEYALQTLVDHTGWYARFDETLAEDRIRGHRALSTHADGQEDER